jgi:thiol-disulfide isomerase/thioredoxin
LSALAALGPFTAAVAQDDLSKKETPAATVKVGDPAPALKATKWFLGDPVTRFEPGKVYVVSFWATWCPSCIGHMPELAELQARYKDHNVTVIGFTSRGIRGVSGNTEEEVAAFVKKRAKSLRLNFALAYADDGTTADAWLKASGQEHFSTFVVDKAERIAYIGSSMFLDLVLPKVLAGVEARVVGDEMAKAVAEYETVFEALVHDFKAGHDLKPALEALKDFEAKYPPLTDLLPVVQAKLSLLPEYGNPGEAKKYAEAIVAKGIKQKDLRLLTLAYSILRNEKESKESMALAVRAAEACVHIDDGKDAQSLLNLADAYFVSGDKTKAKEYAHKAIDAAAGDSAAVRQDIEKEARRLGAEN